MLRNQNLKIVEKFKYMLIVSLVIILVGVGFAVYRVATGDSVLNFGIDFTGGAIIEITSADQINTQDVKDLIEGEKFDINGDIQTVEADGAYIYEVRLSYTKDGKKVSDEESFMNEIFTRDTKDDLCGRIETMLIEKGAAVEDNGVRGYSVGETASDSLTRMAIIAIVVALVVMLIYIVIRFTFSSALAAVCTLAHDVLVMLALMSIFNVTINSTFIAAVITIIGYAINASIVIFDRVRAEIKLGTDKSDKEIANSAVQQSLRVNILSSLTTLVMVVFLVIFSVSSIGEFVYPIIFGLIASAFSAFFFGPALWVKFRKLDGKKSKKTDNGYKGAVKQDS